MNSRTSLPKLTQPEVERFYERGFSGPYACCSPEQMSVTRRRIQEEVFPTPGPWPEYPEQLRHQDTRLVYDLCANPEIVGRLASLWGPDTLVWRSNFFDKPPGGKA